MEARRPRARAFPLTPAAQPSRRKLSVVDEVLRAKGVVVGVPVSGALLTHANDEDGRGAGLTRSLKHMSVAPVGACIQKSFDPDYCTKDKFYAFGMAVTTAAIGALLSTPVYTDALLLVSQAINGMIKKQCESYGWKDWFMGDDALDGGYGQEYRRETFCSALIEARKVHTDVSGSTLVWRDALKRHNFEDHVVGRMSLAVESVAEIVLAPLYFLYGGASRIAGDDIVGFRLPYGNPIAQNRLFQIITGVIEAKWVQLLLSKLNEVARGVGSYFRVNYRDWKAGNTLTHVNPIEFARKVAYDILPEDDEPDDDLYEPFDPDAAPPPLEPSK